MLALAGENTSGDSVPDNRIGCACKVPLWSGIRIDPCDRGQSRFILVLSHPSHPCDRGERGERYRILGRGGGIAWRRLRVWLLSHLCHRGERGRFRGFGFFVRNFLLLLTGESLL
jgi:hypothetical protein